MDRQQHGRTSEESLDDMVRDSEERTWDSCRRSGSLFLHLSEDSGGFLAQAGSLIPRQRQGRVGAGYQYPCDVTHSPR